MDGNYNLAVNSHFFRKLPRNCIFLKCNKLCYYQEREISIPMKHAKIWAFTVHPKEIRTPDQSELLDNFHFLHDSLRTIINNTQIHHFYSKKRSTHVFYTTDLRTALSINPEISGMSYHWGNIMKRIYPRQKFYQEILQNLKANRDL